MWCHVKLILPSTQGRRGSRTFQMWRGMTNSFPERRSQPRAMSHRASACAPARARAMSQALNKPSSAVLVLLLMVTQRKRTRHDRLLKYIKWFLILIFSRFRICCWHGDAIFTYILFCFFFSSPYWCRYAILDQLGQNSYICWRRRVVVKAPAPRLQLVGGGLQQLLAPAPASTHSQVQPLSPSRGLFQGFSQYAGTFWWTSAVQTWTVILLSTNFPPLLLLLAAVTCIMGCLTVPSPHEWRPDAFLIKNGQCERTTGKLGAYLAGCELGRHLGRDSWHFQENVSYLYKNTMRV